MSVLNSLTLFFLLLLYMDTVDKCFEHKWSSACKSESVSTPLLKKLCDDISYIIHKLGNW